VIIGLEKEKKKKRKKKKIAATDNYNNWRDVF
jgi:hypothetical protein